MNDTIPYDFEAGDLSLDFANTMDWHGSEKPGEMLLSYADLVTWGERAGLLTPEDARRLIEKERDQPQDTAQAYQSALRLREAIYRVFSKRYAGEPIPEDDLMLLNSVVRQAMAHLKLSPMDGEFRWEWSAEVNGINRLLFPIARSAAELLTSERVNRVRECEDDRGCGYLFIDQTKNHSRRWCSMESCGNRAKARRHYSRLQAN